MKAAIREKIDSRTTHRDRPKWDTERRMPWPEEYFTQSAEPVHDATPLAGFGLPATDGNRRKMPLR